jgi:cytochrome c-type biogenesis protein CcmE
MTRRQQRILGVVLIASGAALATAFTLTAFRKNLMSFYTPSDITAQTPAGAPMRLGGLVEAGTLKRVGGLRVEFIVADCTHKVPVSYEGILPDLFRENQAVIATGRRVGDEFHATQVLAKHDEQYMPREVAEAMGKAHEKHDVKTDAAPAAGADGDGAY